MKIFVESIDRGIWDAIVNGRPFVPKIEKDDVFKGCYKKYKKKGKSRRAYNDDSSSSSSSKEDEEEANLCFMAKDESESSSVSSCTSINFENYSQLLNVFEETHEEANRLALLNNQLKGLNNWLENKVKTLEEELNNSKKDFESLEMIYKTLLASMILAFVKIVNHLKRKSTTYHGQVFQRPIQS